MCVCGLKWDVCEWPNLFNRRRTILAWPCSTARQRAGLEKSLIGKKFQKNVDTTWNHPRVGSWCLSRGHCQGGLSEQQSHQPWRIMATNPTSSLLCYWLYTAKSSAGNACSSATSSATVYKSSCYFFNDLIATRAAECCRHLCCKTTILEPHLKFTNLWWITDGDSFPYVWSGVVAAVPLGGCYAH